ncbi:MAG: hypothetical protein AB8C02_01685 [Halioglobus sp.]
MSADSALCSNPECDVAETGVCILGNDPIEACPNFGQQNTNLESQNLEEIDKEPVNVSGSAANLLSNDLLSEVDLFRLRKQVRTQTVVIIGEQRVGKTTLIASIYGLLCKGRVGDLCFAGSRTLLAFARRHHLALLQSQRKTPATPRTSRSDPVGFFHLSLSGSDHVTELVVSDRSGEAFEAARINTDLIDELSELRLADRICVLLDSDKLTSLEFRTGYKRGFKQLLRALDDNGALKAGVMVEVLATKIDKLNALGDAGARMKQVEQFEAELNGDFQSFGSAFSCHRVCALPISQPELGFLGLEELLQRWCEPRLSSTVTPDANVVGVRQIDKILKNWSVG